MVSNMQFDDALLSSYLAKHLQPLTPADPNLLARYVAALLKHNKPKEEVEALCIDKLFDFLGDESESFVQNLFEAFEKGTILASKDDHRMMVARGASTVRASVTSRMAGNVSCNGAIPDGRSCTHVEKLLEGDNGISDNSKEEEDSDDDNDGINHKLRRRVSTPSTLDRDTYGQVSSLEERNIPAMQPLYVKSTPSTENSNSKGLGTFCAERDDYDHAYAREDNQHSFRRGVVGFRGNGLGSRFEYQNSFTQGAPGHGKGTLSEHKQKTVSDGHGSKLSISPLGLPCNPYSSHTKVLQSLWEGFPGVRAGPHDDTVPLNQVMEGLTVRRSRCADFEERGYCLRGDLCPMDHGANTIIVEDFQSLSKLNLPFAISSEQGMTLESPISSGFCNSTLFTRDVSLPMDSPSFSKGTLSLNTSSEPDLYDPDQPLLGKQLPIVLAGGFKRPSSFRKDLEEDEADLAVLKRHREHSLHEDKFEEFSSVSMLHGLNQEQLLVWNNTRHHNYDNSNMKTSTDYNDAHLKAERGLAVENYVPESIVGINENYLIEEDDSLAKTVSSKVGTSCAPQGDAGLNYVNLTSQGKLSVGTQVERAHRTLYVGCIPKGNKKKELLRAHFRKFGEVVDVRIPSQGDRAFVQFSQREEAEAALKSPEAVLGNRFIRLSWAKRDSVPFSFTERDLAAPLTTGYRQNAVLERSDEALSMKAQQPAPLSALSERNALTTTGKASQTFASAAASKKQQELELTMEELRRKQDELARKREDFRRQLERYSKQGFRGLHGDQISSISSDDSKADLQDEQSGSKQETLEKLEAGIKKSHKEISALSASIEKALLSADHSNLSIAKDSVKIPLCPSQVESPTQLFQGGLKCSLVGTSAGFSQGSQRSLMRKLDNCSTAFHVLPPFPDGLLDKPAFMEHFSRFEDLSNVEVDDVNQGVKVTFYTRSAAEKAFLQGGHYQGTYLCFSWVKQSSSITAGASSDGAVTFDATSGNASHHSSKATAEL